MNWAITNPGIPHKTTIIIWIKEEGDDFFNKWEVIIIVYFTTKVLNRDTGYRSRIFFPYKHIQNQNDFFAIIFNLHLFSKIMIYLFFYYDYVVIKIQKIFSCALSSKLYATICAFIIGRLQSYHMFFYVLKLLCENEFTLAPSMLLRQSSWCCMPIE